MIITLSEKRNEKLVFDDDYTVPYILERFGVNIYGGGYICIVYKDNKPVAALGGIRNDLNGKVAFQGEHFATLPQFRKSGYNVDLRFTILDEVGKRFPDALIFGFPNDEARAVCIAAGDAKAELYQRIY